MFETDGLLEDVEHLKSLDPSFVSQVDLVLCASDGSSVVGFPVHIAIVSSHSPILSRCFEDLSKGRESPNQHLPRFPMVDDDCSAVRSMLACMYGRLPLANSQQAALRLSQSSQDPKMIPVEASKLRLTHKYGMLAIMQEQETLLLPVLHQLIHPAKEVCSRREQCTLVLKTAKSAEECKSARILAVCEAFIAQQFDVFSTQSFVLSNELTSASLLRIAQGVSMCRENTINNLKKALEESESDAKNFSREYFQQKMKCPRCNEALDRSNKCNTCHLNRSSSCKWPGGHDVPPVLSMSDISNKMLQLI